MYWVQNLYFFYKNIGFNIKRKQDKLKQVIDSHDFWSRETFNKAKKLHKSIGFRKVAENLNVPESIVYR